VTISAMEVYKNKINTLLPNSRDPTRTEVHLYDNQPCGLGQRNLKDYKSAMAYVQSAKKSRVTHSTNANDTSSRSHCIIQLKMRQKSTEGTGEVRESKLNLIDLAGSERVNQTGLSMGERMTEACNINSSLLALKKCISALSRGKNHIPFRDSKLTTLLQDCLEGECLTYIIACVSPSGLQWQSTRDTLEYGTQARAIRMTAKKQYRPRVTLRQRVAELTEQNIELIGRLRGYEKEETVARCRAQRMEEEFRKREKEMELQLKAMREQHERAMQALKDKEESISVFEAELRGEIGIGKECVVCKDRLATHAFIPCGHRCVCRKCSGEITKREGAKRRCPLCRQQAHNITQIFNA